MTFNTVLKFLVAIEALSGMYIRAGVQSVAVDDTTLEINDGVMYSTNIADVVTSDTKRDTLSVDGGGRFDGINNLHHTVVGPVTHGDGSSSTTVIKSTLFLLIVVVVSPQAVSTTFIVLLLVPSSMM